MTDLEAIYQDDAVRQEWIRLLELERWGDTRMAVARLYLDALAKAGYHVVQEGQVPPWMEQVPGRAATDGNYSHQGEHWYRLRPLTDEAPT